MPPDPQPVETGQGAEDYAFERIAPDDERTSLARPIAEEIPVAIELNGIGYAVLMATGMALEDLAYGFALSERLIDTVDQIVDLDVHHADLGIILRLTLAHDCTARIHDRVRHRSSDSSCGLCGIENLEQAVRPLPRLIDPAPVATAAIFAALTALRDHQPLNAITGAVHAAAMCAPDGTIVIAREDVGRHNAFDKLIGAMLRERRSWGAGFALLSSRCSYELVEKAVLAGCPTLITISAPTDLALKRAAAAGLQLIVLARSDSILRTVKP
ncbi:formate dehydrogenase accessory sulfurtransferase FdhD [Sphingomonas sp. ERG5]|uniref:formate dehydrogenase accessory sulfurtransferase FdhD n=1 Tax=Sphingomonas sp. ERG5 TaxID=1381597 RepID=UPI00054B433B|nr:formate dehydrogenase accessory sulfurtransferase FdhD [Sphingomonas sp. ERG5]